MTVPERFANAILDPWTDVHACSQRRRATEARHDPRDPRRSAPGRAGHRGRRGWRGRASLAERPDHQRPQAPRRGSDGLRPHPHVEGPGPRGRHGLRARGRPVLPDLDRELARAPRAAREVHHHGGRRPARDGSSRDHARGASPGRARRGGHPRGPRRLGRERRAPGSHDRAPRASGERGRGDVAPDGGGPSHRGRGARRSKLGGPPDRSRGAALRRRLRRANLPAGSWPQAARALVREGLLSRPGSGLHAGESGAGDPLSGAPAARGARGGRGRGAARR